MDGESDPSAGPSGDEKAKSPQVSSRLLPASPSPCWAAPTFLSLLRPALPACCNAAEADLGFNGPVVLPLAVTSHQDIAFLLKNFRLVKLNGCVTN